MLFSAIVCVNAWEVLRWLRIDGQKVHLRGTVWVLYARNLNLALQAYSSGMQRAHFDPVERALQEFPDLARIEVSEGPETTLCLDECSPVFLL